MGITRLKPLYDSNGNIKGYVNKYTGEEYGFPVLVGRKKRPYGNGWLMNSQEALEILAKDKEITGETYRVLFFVCARLDFENWVQISVTEMAQELELKQPNVSRAMKVLEQKGIILRGPKVGRSYAFMLNPEFGWKGDVANLNEYRKKREDEENQRKNRERYEKNLELVGLSKKDQLIMAIKEGKVDIEKLYDLVSKGEKTDDDQE
ncbi:replication/maintenance protein RepL [Crocosphaera watsonii]|uniref:RepA n=2 Tax=Crocosphaera watsonii TaxID=263511 RepID=G5JEB6_CROWT|nr:replication/maintenance protein RepL [Crocosphaera watsonii]EHJ09466.1 RepA [Crocosphaera watsonii WH 0003]CCQ56700.1 RepA [Crocosphaera watsonii WH 0005]